MTVRLSRALLHGVNYTNMKEGGSVEGSSINVSHKIPSTG